MLKDKGGLNAGWCRAFGLAAHTIGALALAVAHNLRELKQTIRVERTQTQKPRRRPARPKSIQATRRKLLTAPSLPERRPDRHPAAPAAPTVTPTVAVSVPGQPKPGTPKALGPARFFGMDGGVNHVSNRRRAA